MLKVQKVKDFIDNNIIMSTTSSSTGNSEYSEDFNIKSFLQGIQNLVIKKNNNNKLCHLLMIADDMLLQAHTSNKFDLLTTLNESELYGIDDLLDEDCYICYEPIGDVVKVCNICFNYLCVSCYKNVKKCPMCRNKKENNFYEIGRDDNSDFKHISFTNDIQINKRNIITQLNFMNNKFGHLDHTQYIAVIKLMQVGFRYLNIDS